MNDSGKNIIEQIDSITAELEPEIVQLRRTFHEYPELSWKEHNTAERIIRTLRRDGLAVRSGICGTGIVAEMTGSGLGKTIAVRADMDALPLHDAKRVPYASKVTGVMHACGHDCHMAIAIGVIKTLQRLSLNFPGKVRFIFQPSEESTPSGAQELVRASVMEDVDNIVALHVDPELPAGQIGLREGALTANCTEFRVAVLGKSGHGARPHKAIDSIFVSNQVMSAIYNIVGSSDSFSPAVLSIGAVHGGAKANVLPERVDIAGTIRTIDEATREGIMSVIEHQVHDITHGYGARYQLEFLPPIPSVVNDPAIIDLIRNVIRPLRKDVRTVDIEKVSMGGEDFSWYLTKAPGALFRLGARKSTDEEIRHLHTSSFDIDEKALRIGVTVMTLTVLQYLLGNDLVLHPSTP